MYDPFAITDIEERPTIEEEMVTIPIGGKVLGIDEGLFVGIVAGFIIASWF